MGKIPDEEFGGTHFMGTGTYEARTPEQARELYAQLPKGSHEEQQRLEAESRREHPELWDDEPGSEQPGSEQPGA
jgi:hypothetical protein